MIRTFRMMGLLTVAALAMSATVASAAHAEKVKFTSGTTSPLKHTASAFHAEQYGTHLENYLEANGVKISCENESVMLTGETKTGEDEDLTVTPEYNKCGTVNEKGEKNELATVNMNGCTYTLTKPTFLETNTYTGKIDLVCAGKGPVVSLYANATHTILLCEVEIKPNQTELSHIVYHNKSESGKKDDITGTVTVGGIKYQNGSQAGCPDHLEHANGEYKSNLTVTSIKKVGETVPGEDDLWISGTE